MDETADVRPGSAKPPLAGIAPARADLLRALGQELVLLVCCSGQSASELRAWEGLHQFLPWFLFEDQLRVWMILDDEGVRKRARRDDRLPHVPLLTRREARAISGLPGPGDEDQSEPVTVLLDRGLRVRFESRSLGPEDVDQLRETTDRARNETAETRFEVPNV